MLPFSSVPTVPPVLGTVTVVVSSLSVTVAEPPPGRLMLPSVPTVVSPSLFPMVISGPSPVWTVEPSGTVMLPFSSTVTLPLSGLVMIV